MIRDKGKIAELKVRRRKRIRSFYLHEDNWAEFDKITAWLEIELGRPVFGSETLGIMIEECKREQV